MGVECDENVAIYSSSAEAVFDDDEDVSMTIVYLERDGAVVAATMLVSENDHAGCRLTHDRVMMLQVLASWIKSARYDFSVPGSASYLHTNRLPVTPSIRLFVVFIEARRCHQPSLPICQRPGCMSQRV